MYPIKIIISLTAIAAIIMSLGEISFAKAAPPEKIFDQELYCWQDSSLDHTWNFSLAIETAAIKTSKNLNSYKIRGVNQLKNRISMLKSATKIRLMRYPPDFPPYSSYPPQAILKEIKEFAAYRKIVLLPIEPDYYEIYAWRNTPTGICNYSIFPSTSHLKSAEELSENKSVFQNLSDLEKKILSLPRGSEFVILPLPDHWNGGVPDHWKEDLLLDKTIVSKLKKFASDNGVKFAKFERKIPDYSVEGWKHATAGNN